MRFPLITIGDMVNAQRRLVERLGITQADRDRRLDRRVPGARVGDPAPRSRLGVVAARRHRGARRRRASPLNEIGRRAIMADPDWRGGEYRSEGVFPAEGLAIARMVAMVDLPQPGEHGHAVRPQPGHPPGLYPSFGATFDVEGYLHYHGEALVRRFDANSYLYLTRAMDLYDVARDGGEEHWLRQHRRAGAAGRDP